METKTTLQSKMFSEIESKRLFNDAQNYAYEYLNNVFERPVFPTEEAMHNLNKFEESIPKHIGNAEDIIRFLNTYGSPATVPTLGGRYFGFVSGSTVPVGLAAKNLATYWDQAPAMNILSPIGSKLESVVENWLKQLFDLPDETVAGFVSGTSTANFCGLAAARYRLLIRQGWDVNEQGLFGAPKIRIVAGEHAHSTILKAIALLGFGKDHIEWVAVDDQGRIKPEMLPELDEHTILILQAGNVNSGSFDDFEKLCDKASKANSWVHIDGAFGLWASAVEQLKHLTKGIEKASSWAVDGHKTLNTPYDCGIVMCSDPTAMVSALHMSAGYIITSEERDGMFYTPEMSRRARIIELWATMKYLGRTGIDEMVMSMHIRAKQFGKLIAKHEGFEVLNDIVFNQVILCCKTDEITDKTIQQIQNLRECWVGGSVWFEKKIIRISICSWATTSNDIERAVASFTKALNEVTKQLK